MSQFEKVREFHKAFEAKISEKPSFLTEDEFRLRMRLIDEELREYQDAYNNDDLVEMADALVDLVYVVLGTAVAHGFHNFDKMFDEVHRSNMSKLGADGKPIIREDGKVLKGPNFFRPQLKPFLVYNNV